VDVLAGNVRGSRTDKLAWIAAREALAAANLGPDATQPNAERTGVVLGCTVGGMLGTEQFLGRLLRDRKHRFGALRFHECAGAADLCARQLGALGPCATVSTACSSGAMAIAAAAELIEQDEADVVLAGAADGLCRLTLNGFGSLLLLDPNGCRPFDAHRAGISLGEGAAMLVIESEATACARGAVILARLDGWGASCDAFHPTAPHPEGRGALAAMQTALGRNQLQTSEIGFVSAHGTGTPDNDLMESRALRRLFGDRLPPVASVKRFFGHTLAASGAIQAVLCVQALREQAVPANLGFVEADAQLGLEPVRAFRPHSMSRVLSNSFGFGGNNVALVFARHEDRPQSPLLQHSITSLSRPALAVIGTGVVSAAGMTLAEINAAFVRGGAATALVDAPAATPSGRTRVYACREFGAEQFIEPARRRKLSRIQQMAVTAAHRSLDSTLVAGIAPERVCVVVGTGFGSLNDTAGFVENMILKDEAAPRPSLFANSVHNSLASQVALELNLTGLNSTPIQRDVSFETALWQGASEVGSGRADIALVGSADELNSYALATGMRWGWWNETMPEIRPFMAGLERRQRPLPGEGCAVFALARAGTAAPVLATVSAVRIGRCETGDGRGIDAAAEAQWIAEALELDGLSARDVDMVLTGANGWPWLDGVYRAVADVLSRRAGRRVMCGAYKQCCGEHHSASAFGFFTAIGLVRGDIAPGLCASGAEPAPVAGPCRTVVLYSLSPTGTKGMCCVRA
jgi:3-oxoacyl-(acyl-carrier-protein) synthase